MPNLISEWIKFILSLKIQWILFIWNTRQRIIFYVSKLSSYLNVKFQCRILFEHVQSLFIKSALLNLFRRKKKLKNANKRRIMIITVSSWFWAWTVFRINTCFLKRFRLKDVYRSKVPWIIMIIIFQLCTHLGKSIFKCMPILCFKRDTQST